MGDNQVTMVRFHPGSLVAVGIQRLGDTRERERETNSQKQRIHNSPPRYANGKAARFRAGCLQVRLPLWALFEVYRNHSNHWRGTQMGKRRSSNLRDCLWVQLPPVPLVRHFHVAFRSAKGRLFAERTTTLCIRRPVRLVVQDARFSVSRHGFDPHTGHFRRKRSKLFGQVVEWVFTRRLERRAERHGSSSLPLVTFRCHKAKILVSSNLKMRVVVTGGRSSC